MLDEFFEYVDILKFSDKNRIKNLYIIKKTASISILVNKLYKKKTSAVIGLAVKSNLEFLLPLNIMQNPPFPPKSNVTFRCPRNCLQTFYVPPSRLFTVDGNRTIPKIHVFSLALLIIVNVSWSIYVKCQKSFLYHF